MADEIYREKYVAFIDMLGFSALVRDADTDVTKRTMVMDAIDRLRNTSRNNPRTGTITTYFSDCIVVSSDRTPSGLSDILDSARIIAENLLQVNVLIRGGFAVGGVYHTDEFMFGPAMIDAYELENKKGQPPTIVASPAFWADVVAAGSWAESWFVHDTDTPEVQHYLHYLQSFAAYRQPAAGLLAYDLYAQQLRHYIARRLRDHQGSMREKAVWLRRYWNETVGVHGILGMVDEVADLEDPQVMPYRTQHFLIATANA